MAVSYGGQAVLEGVMMRGPSNWSVAVRKPDGEIAHVSRHIESPMKRHRLARLPVVRGVFALGESLAIGFRGLAISANYAAQDETKNGDEPQGAPGGPGRRGGLGSPRSSCRRLPRPPRPRNLRREGKGEDRRRAAGALARPADLRVR